jgi:hypothetical protein
MDSGEWVDYIGWLNEFAWGKVDGKQIGGNQRKGKRRMKGALSLLYFL